MKKFSQSVYRVGNIDVSIPDGPDRTLFRDRSGKQHLIVHIYIGTLCQIFYRPGFLIDPLAFHCNCGEDNGDLSVAGLSDCILYCAQ